MQSNPASEALISKIDEMLLLQDWIFSSLNLKKTEFLSLVCSLDSIVGSFTGTEKCVPPRSSSSAPLTPIANALLRCSETMARIRGPG